MEESIAKGAAERRARRAWQQAEPLDDLRRRWHVRMIVAKCGHDAGARFLADQACRDYAALSMLPDAELVALHAEIDRARECAEFDHAPHGFVRAWHG